LLGGDQRRQVRHRNGDIAERGLDRPGVLKPDVTDRSQKVDRDLVLHSDDHVLLDVPEPEIGRRVVLKNAQGFLEAPYVLFGRLHEEVASGPIQSVVVDRKATDQDVPATGPIQGVAEAGQVSEGWRPACRGLTFILSCHHESASSKVRNLNTPRGRTTSTPRRPFRSSAKPSIRSKPNFLPFGKRIGYQSGRTKGNQGNHRGTEFGARGSGLRLGLGLRLGAEAGG
jgi:hypothetical protein